MNDADTSNVIPHIGIAVMVLCVIGIIIFALCLDSRANRAEAELTACRDHAQQWGARAVQESKLRSLADARLTELASAIKAAHPDFLFRSESTYRFVDFSDRMLMTKAPDYFSHTTPAESAAIGELEKP